MAKVTYEFDFFEEREDRQIFENAHEMSSSLFDIYEKVRFQLKYGEEDLSEAIENLLEEIQEISSEFV